jgi:hypothetical protein
MEIKYIAISEAGKFRVVNDKLFREELARLPNGRYDIVVRKHRRSKSNPQLAYYYGVVLPHFLKASVEQGWEFADVNDLDNYLKLTFASRDLINRHTGEILSVPGLKRDMTSTEMATFTDAIKDYAQEFLGYVIPEPETQSEIQYDKAG